MYGSISQPIRVQQDAFPNSRTFIGPADQITVQPGQSGPSFLLRKCFCISLQAQYQIRSLCRFERQHDWPFALKIGPEFWKPFTRRALVSRNSGLRPLYHGPVNPGPNVWRGRRRRSRGKFQDDVFWRFQWAYRGIWRDGDSPLDARQISAGGRRARRWFNPARRHQKTWISPGSGPAPGLHKFRAPPGPELHAAWRN